MPKFGQLSGMPELASYKFPANATTSAVLTIPACEMLQIQFNITGYTGTAIASLRFNGDSATTNYNGGYINASTAAPGTPTSQGAVGMFKLGANAVLGQRSGLVTIYNYLGTAHLITSQSVTVSTGATVPVISVGGGNYNSSTSTQITSVQMVVDTSASVTTGTSFVIFGMNP